MTKQATAKTPTVAIARVLRSLGLEQGHDFSVKGSYRGAGANRERIGTHVIVLTDAADQIVADNADRIEERVVQESGFSFRVSIHYTTGGRLWTWIANYGQRIRDAAPVATADRDSGPLSATGRKLSHELNAPVTKQVPAVKAQQDDRLYGGKAQRQFGSLTWACQEVGLMWAFQDNFNSPVYTLRLFNGSGQVNGWYLFSQGSRRGVWMGVSLTRAAEAAQDTILRRETA